MRRSRVPSFGKEQFPLKRIKRIGQTPLMRCVRCRTPNDTRSTAWANQGDGLGAPTDVVVQGVTQPNTKDRARQAGCQFCGSLNWMPHKPPTLPDDRYQPSDEWRNKRRKRR